jgi:hypothetical protein
MNALIFYHFSLTLFIMFHFILFIYTYYHVPITIYEGYQQVHDKVSYISV